MPALFGPALAGLLVDRVGWRWVFLGVLLLLPPAAMLVLPALRRFGAVGSAAGTAAPIGRLGWAVAAALAALLLHHWGRSPPQSGWGVAGLASVLLLLLVSARALLPRGTLRAARGLPTVVLLRALLAAAFLAAEVFIPLWLTLHAGWGVAAAGAALSAGALCWSAGSALQSRIVDAHARRHVLRAGFAIVAVGIAAQLLVVGGVLPALAMPVLWALAGLGIGIAFPVLSVLLLGLSAPGEQGRNSAALQQSEALAHSALLALAGLLFVALHEAAPRLAFGLLFALPAAMAAVGALLVPRVRPMS